MFPVGYMWMDIAQPQQKRQSKKWSLVYVKSLQS